MTFAEWLNKKEDSDTFIVNGISVRIVEILSEEGYKKFRVSWVAPNGSTSVRYVIASNKRDALNMVKDDLYRATAPGTGKIAGHGGVAGFKDVSEVKGIGEVLRMLKFLLYRQRPLPLTTVDWYDVNTILKALISNEITDPEDVKLANYTINVLRKRNPSLFDAKNWELLYRLKNRPVKIPKLPQVIPPEEIAI